MKLRLIKTDNYLLAVSMKYSNFTTEEQDLIYMSIHTRIMWIEKFMLNNINDELKVTYLKELENLKNLLKTND